MAGDEHDSGEQANHDNVHKYGSPRQHDPSFRGPISHRSCTDIICCIVFILFIIGYAVLCVLSFAWGNPVLLLYPRDTLGNLCGYGSYSAQPNLFFFDLTTCGQVANVLAQGLSCPTPQICVSSCPNYYWSWLSAQAIESASGGYSFSQRSLMLCQYSVNATTWTNLTITQLVTQGYCAPYVLPETPVAGRCLPSALVQGVSEVATFLTSANMTFSTQSNNTVTASMLVQGQQFVNQLMTAVEFVMSIFQDLIASWPLLIIGCIIAALVSLLWLIILRYFAAAMVWLVLICFLGLFGFSTYYTLWRFLTLLWSGSSWTSGTLAASWDYLQDQMWFWLALSCISGLFLLIVIVIIVFLRTRIRIAIALLRQTSAAVAFMMEVLVLPILPFVTHVGLAVFCVAVAAYIATLGMPSPTGYSQYSVPNFSSSSLNATYSTSPPTSYSTTQQSASVSVVSSTVSSTTTTASNLPPTLFTISFSCSMINQYNVTILNQFAQYCTLFQTQVRSYVVWLELANLFMFFWLFSWITGFFQMSAAGAFASYYFSRERPKDIPCCPVMQSAWRVIRYHLGTIAFGSFLIAVVQLIRVILQYIQNHCKKENSCTKFVLKCLICCMYCLEKCLKFITKNAYIMCAIRGKNFCFSAKDAFSLIMRNCVRVFVLDMVTDFVLLIGKLVVVGGLGTLSYFIFTGYFTSINAWIPKLNYFVTPMIVLIIMSYIISNVFFTVYEMGVDTIFLSFLEDLEMNDGSPEKPYFMNKELRKILHKRNRTAEHQEPNNGEPQPQPQPQPANANEGSKKRRRKRNDDRASQV